MILVVGAGPVGLTAALELTRRGQKVRIVEREKTPAKLSKALAINPRTLELLEASGVSERLIGAGRRLKGLQLMRRLAAPRATLRLEKLPHRFNFLLILPQAETEAHLNAALVERGLEVERGIEASLLAGDPVKPRLLLRSDSHEEEIAPDLVLAADGAHSPLRHAFQLDFAGHRAPETIYLADVVLEGMPDQDYGCLFPKGRHLLAVLPLPPKDSFRLIGLEKDPLELLPGGVRVKETIWVSTFQISYRLIDRFSQGAIHFAGDAAHIHSPVGGRGMNLGIEDASTFASLVASHRLGDYEMRRARAKAVLKATERFTRLITLTNPAGIALRNNLLFPLLDSALIQRRLLPSLAGIDYPNPVGD